MATYPITKTLHLYRGDDWLHQFPHAHLAADVSAASFAFALQADSLPHYTLTNDERGQIVSEDNSLRVHIPCTDTLPFPPGAYLYEVKLVANERATTIGRGSLFIEGYAISLGEPATPTPAQAPDSVAAQLARLREELTALEYRQAQHSNRLDLLAQAQITAEHDIKRTHALASRALMRPGTLAAPLTIPAHLQDMAVSIAPHAGEIRQFNPTQFVRIGPAVGQLRNPSTDDHGNEVWTLKIFTKQGAGATFTAGTAVELIGNRADATPYFD